MTKFPLKLMMIFQYSSSEMVIRGLERFKQKYDTFFSEISLYYVSDIENNRVPEKELGNKLKQADLILVDVRSNRITGDLLEKYVLDRNDVDILFLLGMGFGSVNHRLSGFDLAKMIQKYSGKGKKENKSVNNHQNNNRNSDTEIEVFHEKIPKSGFDMRIIYRMQKVIRNLGRIIPFGKICILKDIYEIVALWETGKTENFVRILEILASKYYGLKIKKRDMQQELKSYKAAFWLPEKGDSQVKLSKFVKNNPLNSSKPTLLVIMYGTYHFNHSSAAVRYIFEKFESNWNIIPFYTDGVFTTKYLNEFIDFDNPPFDAILSLIWFPFNGGPGGGNLEITHKLLKKWNKPIFLGIGQYNQKVDDFRNLKEGLNPITILASVIFPEMDGLIDAIPLISSKDEKIRFCNKEMNLVLPHVYSDNIDLMMKRIEARISLRTIPNSDKKVAMILLNYPPGEANIGSAAYFDGIKSTLVLLKNFRDRGYNVDLDPSISFDNPHSLKDWMIANGIVNTPRFDTLESRLDRLTSADTPKFKMVKISSKKFNSWMQIKLNPALKKSVEKAWGVSPGDIHVVNDDLYLPIVSFGNIYLGVQPSRGDVEDIERSYHDETLPPHYEYLAFYYYLSEEIHVNAMIHMGTHGTLEFLPGKEVGLHPDFCYNFSMMDYVPHFYLYQISNTSEAMIAKRRSMGTLITYQLPPLVDNGLALSFSDIEEQIHLYEEAKSLNNPDIESIEKNILQLAKDKGIIADDVDLVSHEILKLKSELIPSGLHVIGEDFGLEETCEYLWNIQPMIPVRPNLYELFGRQFNLEKDIIEDMAHWVIQDINDPIRQKIKILSINLIRDIISGSDLHELQMKFIELGFLRKNSAEMNALIKILRNYAALIQNSDEIENLFKGLNGDFIPISMGGDPIRNPDILPTGNNMYQFNPQLIPTEMAMRRGKKAAEQTIDLYRKENNGEYPKNLVHVLWGFETAKTHGEAVGEILTYMGVRLKSLSSWKREPELIPLKILGRPRINVTIQICGFMRDLFSHVLEILDDAVDLTIDNDENSNDNYVKSQYITMRKNAVSSGSNSQDAEFAGRVRIFGPDASEYGSVLPTLIESGAWKNPKDLGNAWTNQMHFGYRKNVRAKPSKEIFTKTLSNVDAITQIRDSTAYAITDLDHYYEFVGGISQAAQVSGNSKKPTIFINDTSNINVETTSIKKAINRGVITRTANPKWVKGMLKHDYSGGKKVSDRVNYILGFSATTEQVDNETWNNINSTYIDNEEIREMMKQNNVYAFHRTLESLLEAIQRKLWDATEEQEKKIKELYLELEGIIEQ